MVRLKDPPHLLLDGRPEPVIPTLIFIRFQPHEEVLIRIGAKRPGAAFELAPAGLKLDYAHLATGALPDAYENVFNEVLTGDHAVFPGPREIERSHQRRINPNQSNSRVDLTNVVIDGTWVRPPKQW